MVKEIYFIESSYTPTAASINRLFAYADFFLKKGITPTFVFLIPDENNSKCERCDTHFNYLYLWENSPYKNKYLNTIRSLIKLRKMMKPEIPVYVYSLLNCLPFILKKNIHVYHEYTEHPEEIGVIHNKIGKYLFKKYKKALTKIDGLFVITNALREYYIRHMGIGTQQVDVINMIVAPHRFSNLKELPITNTISYCGCISESKDGVSCLIEAFALVHAKHKEYNLRIIGKFENSQTESILKALVNKLGIKNYVDFTGPILASELPALLTSSKILALARPDNKQAKYGFATKIGEYLMTERPIVLTRVGAVEDFLTDMDNCILAKPDDVEDFSEKLLWTIENYDKATEIGKNGKLIALKYFNAEIESEKIYHRIIQKL